MIHFFFVNSNMTYVSAASVIKYKKLEPHDVVIVYERIVPKEDGFLWQKFPFEWSSNFCHPSLNLKLFVRQRRNLFDIIDEWCVDRRFLIYLPHAKFAFVPIMFSHHGCRGHYFIDEGSLNWLYLSNKLEDQEIKNTIFLRECGKAPRRYLGLFLRRIYGVFFVNRYIIGRKYFTTDYIAVFASTQFSFSNFDRRVELLDSFELISHDRGFLIPENSHVFLSTALIEYGFASYDIINIQVERHLTQHEINEVYLKFHPAQDKDNARQVYLKLFESRGVKVNVIPDDYVIEKDIFVRKDLNFIGQMSTLIELCKRVGANVTELI